MCVCSTNVCFSMVPGTYYVPGTYVPGISRPKSIRTYFMFRPWTHTSDDSYICQLSLVVATATVSFERSEFLIATSPPKNLCVCACVRLILVLVWGTYYVPDTYVPHFMIPGTYYVPDTYVLCTRYVCTTLAVVLLIVQLYHYLFIR